MEKNEDEIRSVLSERRKELGYTMKDVAKLVGVSEATISRWESGDIANMRRDRIAKLADALEISPAVIMGWEDSSARFKVDFHLFGEDRPDDVDSLFIEKYSQDVYDAAMMYNDLDVNGRYKVIGYMDSLSAEKGVKKEVKIKPPAKAAAGTVKIPVTPKPKTRSRGTRSKSVPPIQQGKGLKVAASKRPELSREEVSRLIAARSKAKSEKKK